MQISGSYLITTADERTWKFDRPVIFLGEWCLLYNRRHIWQGMNKVVAKPYGLGLAKKDTDNAESRTIEEKLFTKLCAVLNQHHGTNYSLRFWRIVLGHWFRRIIDVLINRIKTLEQCMLSYEISGFSAYENFRNSLANPDSASAIQAFNDDRWNNAVDTLIINSFGFADSKIDVIKEKKQETHTSNYRNGLLNFKKNIRKSLLELAYFVISKPSRILLKHTDAFIMHSYLPKIEEIKLEIALGQWPQMWRSPKLEINNRADILLREKIKSKLKEEKNNIEDIIEEILIDVIPICWLEGFNELNKSVVEQPWPRNPKFIWTSNSFDTDEVFKLWTAYKTEQGIKYYAGQHGNNYGTYRYMNPAIEEITSDKFLTWGWTDGLQQHIPSFIFKTVGKYNQKYDQKGGLLLIEVCLNHRITTWDGSNEFGSYFEDQKKFIKYLGSSQRKELTIRLHAGYRFMRWDEENRWREFDANLKIDTGEKKINKLISKSRLIVHSYDSTGILELLSQNVPMLAFWQNGFDHLRDNSHPYYQLLVDVGILHLSPESAADKVNEVWDDVDNWWCESNLQVARREFCARYARVIEDPIKQLKIILNPN
jgi:putative transferase (TIGR04331 family)